MYIYTTTRWQHRTVFKLAGITAIFAKTSRPGIWRRIAVFTT